MQVMACGYSPEDKQLAERIIMHVKREISQKHSYLEKGIFHLKSEATEKVKYLGASYTTLYYNPLGVISLYEKSPSKVEKAIIHAVLHCMLLHPSFNAGDKELFDAAADAIVNAMLENSSFGGNQNFNNFLKSYKVDTVAQLYKAACEDKQLQKRLTAIVDKHKVDDHCTWYLKDDENNALGMGNAAANEEAEADWKSMFSAAKSSSNMLYGDSTGNMFMSLLPPDRFSRFSYDEYIRRFTEEEIVEDDPENIDMMLYTMSMDMYDDTPIVEWNEVSERCNPSDLIIAIDMSGSCGGETASNFLRQIYSLFEAMDIRGSVNIQVVFFDTKILKKCVIRNKKEAEEFIRGYSAFGFGGTNFNCVFDYADNFQQDNGGKQLKGLFFFSDACGLFPPQKKNYQTTFFVPYDSFFDAASVPDWIELVHYND